MNGITAIVKKELRSYFLSPLAYVMIGVFLFIMGIVFAKFVAIYQQYTFNAMMGRAPAITLDKLANYLYQNMAFFLCFFTPLLTMRLFSEEKRQKTMELLLTSPISSLQLVLGKYLAAFILMSLMISITFIYVFFMILWGNPEITIIASTYAGLFLSLACYIGLGMFISSLTESQAIASIFTFIALLFLWLVQSLAEGMDVTTWFINWGTVLKYISPLGHYGSFSEGLIQVKDIVYFLSFIVFSIFLTHRVIESHRWS